MTRFEMQVEIRSTSEASAARRELRRRYPEIELVRRVRLGDGRERWTCVSPTATHLCRWVAEQQLVVSASARRSRSR